MTSPNRCSRFFKTIFVFSLIVIPLIFIFFLINNDKYIKSEIRKEYKSVKDKQAKIIKAFNKESSRLTKVKVEKENALKKAKKSKPPDETLKKQLEKDIKDATNAVKQLKKSKNYSSKALENYSTKMEKNKPGYLRYLMAITALYWITSLIPISPVGIFPLTIVPLMRAITVGDMIKSYMTDVNMVILTASIITLGISSAGLSKRVAYRIMSLSGANRRLTAVCVSLISLLFSMWWVNTAVMIFMCRAIDDIVHELKEGVSYGTLGNARKDEWNETNTAVAEAKARRRSNWEAKKAKEGQSDDQDFTKSVELTTHTKKSDEFLNPHAGGSVFIVEKDMKIIHPGAGKDTDLVEVSNRLPSTTSIRESYISFGSDAHKRHDAMKHEIKHILEEYRMSLHHCAAVFCSVGGLYWSYSSTTGPQLFHKKSVVSALIITDWTTWTFPVIVMTVPFLLFCMDLAHFGPDYLGTVFHFLKLKKSRNIPANTEITPETAKNILEIFQDKYHRLGPLTSQEKSLLALKILTIIALLVRLSESKWGWLYDNVPKLPIQRLVTISDSTVIAIAVIVGFIFPKNIKVFFKGPMTAQEKPLFASMLGWKPVQEYFPWGILLIIGGSVALAEAYVWTGLDAIVVNRFSTYANDTFRSKEGLLIIAMLYTMVLSNCLGGTCGAIVACRYLAQVGGVYVALPCVAATAFAFIFPVGTTTMAVASIKLTEMNSWYCLKKGLLPSVVCTIIVFLFGTFYTEAIIYNAQNPLIG